MVKFAILIFFIVASLGFAEDDSLGPSPRVEEAKPKIEEPQIDKGSTQEKHPKCEAVEAKPAVNELTAKQQGSEQNSDAKRPIDYQWWFNFLLVILTGGLVVTGTLQFLVYREQARYMRKGLDIAEKTAVATQGSVDAAKESASVARETLRIAHRAYLGAEDWQFRNGDDGNPIKIDVALYNSGTTPAKVIGTTWKVYVVKPLPPPPDYSQIAVDPMKPLLIQPKRKTTYTVNLTDLLKDHTLEEIRAHQPVAALVDDKTLNALTLQLILQGKMTLYLSGGIVYETIDMRLLFSLFIQYDSEARRFTAIGEPGYNYEISYNQ